MIPRALLLLSFLAPLAGSGEVVSVRLMSNDPFQLTADFLQSVDEDIFGTSIDGNQVQLMIDLFIERTSCQDEPCYKCLSTERLQQFLGLNSRNGEGLAILDAEDLGRASLVLVYMELNSTITADCNSSADGINSTSYNDIVEAMCQMGVEGEVNRARSCESFTLQQLDWIIEQLNTTYQPLSHYECFTGETLFEDAGIPTKTADRSELEVLFAHLMQRMLQGHCIGQSELVEPDFFIDDLFITYGNADGVLMMDGFLDLLKNIGIFPPHVSDEGAESNHTHTPNQPARTTTESPTIVTILSTPNVTMTTGNVTDNSTVLPTNATIPMPNATVASPNTTASAPNTTASSPNFNTTAPNATVPLPNATVSFPNVSVPTSGGNRTVSPPRWMKTGNATDNSTVLPTNATIIMPNVTTASPNATAFAPNTTAFAPNTTASAPNVNATAPNVNVTAPNATVPLSNATASFPNVTAPTDGWNRIVPPPWRMKTGNVTDNSTVLPTNATIFMPNATTASPNATAFAPNTTAFAPNTTASAPNVNATAPNVNATAPNATVPLPNATASFPNVTAPTDGWNRIVPPPWWMKTGNVTDNSTVLPTNATIIMPNATTASPNATAFAPNTTAFAPNTTASAPNVNATAPNVNATAPNATVPLPNATALFPNVTATTEGWNPWRMKTGNVTDNSTVLPANATIIMPNATNASPNATAFAPNTTAFAPNTTATAPNVNATAPNATVPLPNATASFPNVTAPTDGWNRIVPPPWRMKTGNVTDNSTVLPTNATIIMPNATTASPNATAFAPNTTAFAPNTTASAPNVNATAPNATVPLPNATASFPNVTAPTDGWNRIVPPPWRMKTGNVTDNSTVLPTNATIIMPNATTASPNATAFAPNTTAFAPNTTASAPNVNATAPNVNSTAPNATVSLPNATASFPNVTAPTDGWNRIVPPPWRMKTGNVTDNSTVLLTNATIIMPNATTASPNATAFAPNTTAFAPNTTASAPNVNVTAPNVNATLPNATVFLPDATASFPNMNVPTDGGNRAMPPPRRLETNGFARSAIERTEERSLKKRKRSATLEATHEGNRCFSAGELFDIFNIDPEVGAGREDFARLCPALIQQLSVKSCHEVHREKTPVADVYLWGTLAVLIISLCSLLAVLIIPCAGSTIFNVLMHFLIALSISTLSGDALFHLLPEAMELHGGHGDHVESLLNRSMDHDSFIYKLVAAVGTIYVCFIFEKLFKIASRNSKKSESHGFDEHGLNGYAMDGAVMNTSQNNQNENEHSKGMDELLMEPLKEDKTYCSCRGLNSSSAIVLIGDTAHNFMDGLAIGVAFTANFHVGISTSIAIFCHEVPHELSDFAVLLRNGMNKKMALFWNFISALFAFLGLYVGISIALSDTFHPWIFSITAGLFLYISLVDLTNTLLEVPPHNFVKSRDADDTPLDEESYRRDSLEEAGDNGSSCCVFIVQNIALILGWALTFTLAMYEEKMVHLF